MKSFRVDYTPDAQKIIDKLDNSIRKRILEWIRKNLDGCENPLWKGKALKGDLKDYWRYRVGDYRIIADIKDDKVVILVIDIVKRNDAYK